MKQWHLAVIRSGGFAVGKKSFSRDTRESNFLMMPPSLAAILGGSEKELPRGK